MEKIIEDRRCNGKQDELQGNRARESHFYTDVTFVTTGVTFVTTDYYFLV